MVAYDGSVGIEIEIDRDLCMGSGNCVYAAPGVFALDDETVAVVVDPDGCDEASVLSAARNCPSAAITVRRDGADPA